MRILRKTVKMFLWLIGVLIIVLAIGFGVLWFNSPGKAQPILNANGVEVLGSISTIETMVLGGVEQSMIIRGRDASAPVVLFLHGGPGSPEFPFLRQTNLALENDFVMVYWEQRGAGLSYDPNNLPDGMNLAQFVADAAELSRYLATRFDKEKIYIIGHSWGSILGLSLAEAHPDLFHAYIGTGNAGNQGVGEQVGLDWARMRAAEIGDTAMVESLNGLEIPGENASVNEWGAYFLKQRAALDELGGGVAHIRIPMWKIFGWVALTPEYTVSNKIRYFSAGMFSLENLWPDVMQNNLIADAKRIDIPVYFAQGAYDYQTPTPLARALFDSLDAPSKEYISFEHSAHSPIMEEPEKFNMLMRRVAGME